MEKTLFNTTLYPGASCRIKCIVLGGTTPFKVQPTPSESFLPYRKLLKGVILPLVFFRNIHVELSLQAIPETIGLA
jgi:hypothetical protein